VLLADADRELEQAAQAGSESLAGAALVLHEGITDKLVETSSERWPADLAFGAKPAPTICERWPEALRLESTLGALVKGRCKATNLCLYCARLAAVENSELLTLDALHGVSPMVWLVLSTGTDDLDPAVFYAARHHLVKALRREFADREIEWAALVEFTTGYSEQSGGRRFPHWNVLLKGVTDADLDRIRDVVQRVWCGREEFKAVPKAQHVGTIHAAGGLMRYLALHFQKESQSPPKGWRGHRFLKSRGYLWTDTPTARNEARQSLRLKREVWKAEQAGLEGAQALETAYVALYEANELAWSLVRLQSVPTAFGGDGLPTAWADTVVSV
jgi:hypothetical protein